MLGLFSALLDLFWRESPEEHYARLCHEAEEKELNRFKQKKS